MTVYRRADTNQQVYQARLKVPGVSGYIIRSLKTRDLPTALNQAEDLFYELRAEQKLGMDVRRRFRRRLEKTQKRNLPRSGLVPWQFTDRCWARTSIRSCLAAGLFALRLRVDFE